MIETKKRCENCNRMFGPRKMRNGKTEYPSMFKKKRFCSQTCAAINTEARNKIAAADGLAGVG